MDLQKVAAQAAQAASQRPEGTNEGKGIFTIPFADMVRSPIFMVGDLLGNRNEAGSVRDVSDEHPSVDKADNQRSGNNDDRQIDSRENTRDDKVRLDDSSDKRADSSSDDPSHRAADNNRGKSQDDSRGSDSGENEAQQQAASDNSEGQEAASNDSDNTVTTLSDSESNQGELDTAVAEANVDVEVDAGFGTALDDLLGVTHATNTDHNTEAVKEAANVLSSAAAGPKITSVNETGKPSAVVDNSQINSGENANGEQVRQVQQAQVALARVGAQTQNVPTEVAKNAAEQPLAEQQAKALADAIKSDKPVKVQVNVDNRAGAMVSQTSQSLNANAVAAQESSNIRTANANTPQGTTTDGSQQIPLARVDGSSVVTGQAQALNQLTQNSANVAAESGVNRAAAQVSSTGPQSSHGSGEGVNNTTPGGSINAQQTAAAHKADHTQATRSPQQTRPLAQQISVNISKAVSDGLDRISIQLRPDNLGRVEVKLEVSQNGRVHANIIVERPETLEMLRNDSRNLERALQDAGLDAQSGDLSFNLRDHQENPDDPESNNRIANGDDIAEEGDLEAEIATKLLNGDLGDIISDMRVDIRA